MLPLLALGISLFVVSCDKDDDDPNQDQYNVSGNANGAQEVPAVTTSATGSLSGTYDARTNTLNYSINWTGLSGAVASAHFHGPALMGVSAGVIVSITISTNGVTGNAIGSVILADSTEQHLLNGRLYYNIHTALNPGGEIRGQVLATAK